MNFRAAVLILFDRQFLPLTPQVEQLQNVVEDLVRSKFWSRAAASDGKMRQDKLFELLDAQSGGNRLPLVAFRHFDPRSNWIITQLGRYH